MDERGRAGLPPGPWRVMGVDIRGPDGMPVQTSPEVFRAIDALPLLVEAMRKTVEDLEGPAESPRHRSAFRLREALALVDGEGVAGG